MQFAALLLLGLVMACAQVTLLRESLAAASGNELTVALGLSLWLLGSALGAGVGNLLPARWTRAALIVVSVLSAVAPFFALYSARDVLRLFHVAPGELLTLAQQVAAGALTLGPVCLLIGMAFTLACRLPGITPGRVYLAEAIGWLLGGLAATWVLVTLPPFTIFLALVVPMAAAITLLSASRQPSSPFPGGKGVLGIGLAGLLLIGVIIAAVLRLPATLEARTLALRFPEQTILASRYTRHGHAAVLERFGQRALYENGRLSLVLPEAQAAEEMAHLALPQVRHPRRVLLIGGLDGLLPEVLKYPVDRVTLAEEDPAVTRLVLAHADAATRQAITDPRVRIRYGDPRRTVRRTGEWDAIILNLPEPSTMLLNRFYTEEFFREIAGRRCLRENGVLILRLPGSEVYYGEETVARNGAVYCALAAHFPHVMLTPRATNYLLASSGPLCADPAELGWRMTVQNIQAQYVNQYYFDYLLAPDDAATLTERYAQAPRMNRDLEPVACQQALLLWGRADAGRLANALRALASWPLWAMGLLFLGVVLVGAGASVAPWRRGAGTRWRGLLAVTAAGFAGMALNVLVLLLAQVTLGALYALLGALMAVGMAGIAVGAWLAGRLRLRLIAPLLLGLALALLLPLLAGPAAAWPFAAGVGVLGLLAALAGVMVGAAFPLAVAAGLSPAAIYAADLLGAAAAGLLVGAVLLPAHGLLAACLLLAGMLGLVCIVCRKVTSAAL